MTEGDINLSEKMMDYWTNFIKSGDPNGEGLSTWHPYREDSDIKILDV